MDEIDIDDERHRREEAERRARRHREREKKEQQAAAQGLSAKSSSSGGKGGGFSQPAIKENRNEKERKRREHAAKILDAQQKQQASRRGSSSGSKPPPPPPSSKKKSGKPTTASGPSGSSSLLTPVTIPGGSSIFQSLFTERAEGFFIDLRFRNAPPRPPVGPTFVGNGLDGLLTEEWTQFKPYNTVETRYVYKIHNGEHLRELISRLASSAMDIEKCYLGEKSGGGGGDGTIISTTDNQALGTTATTTPTASHVTANTTTSAEQALSPDDEAILNWTGHMGDTATEALQRDRDKARASARETLARRVGFDRTSNNKSSSSTSSAAAFMGGGSSGKTFKLKKSNHLKSRILDERIPKFMKKTTYLTNDYTSVHRFTSLASTQIQRAREVDTAVAETRERYAGLDVIERSFHEASSSKWSIILPPPSSSSAVVENNEHHHMTNKGNGRSHPTKKNVYPIWDLPLLPDICTWGHTFTHVVLDNPPRSVGGDTTVLLKKNNRKRQLSQQSQGSCNSGVGVDNDNNDNKDSGGGGGGDDILRLNSAIVADVARQEHNARMECTIWVPPHPSSSSSSSEEDGITPLLTPNKKSKFEGEKFVAIQKYDLDVVPLRDPNAPAVHYVWTIDPECNYVGYHPIGSRVQLSMGRPPSAMVPQGGRRQGGGDRGNSNLENGCIIVRRDIDEVESKAFKIRTAELAETHGRMNDGLDDDDDEEN